MPRPNKNWEKKYGNRSEQRRTLLNIHDDVLSASEKLACGVPEARGIILQMMRHATKLPEMSGPRSMMLLLDMDDMGIHGQKIVKAYHEWAGDDYLKLAKGLQERTITV